MNIIAWTSSCVTERADIISAAVHALAGLTDSAQASLVDTVTLQPRAHPHLPLPAVAPNLHLAWVGSILILEEPRNTGCLWRPGITVHLGL